MDYVLYASVYFCKLRVRILIIMSMYSYCYVILLLLLRLCILIVECYVYVYLLLSVVFMHYYCSIYLLLLFCMFCSKYCFIVLFCVLFVCKCVLYYCHRVSTQLQLTNISYVWTAYSQEKPRYLCFATWRIQAVTYIRRIAPCAHDVRRRQLDHLWNTTQHRCYIIERWGGVNE